MVTRVGFVINFNANDWLGGYNYIKNLFFFLKKYQKEIQPVIIVDKKERVSKDKIFKQFEIVTTNLVSNQKKLLKFFNKILIFFFGKSFLLDNFFSKKKIFSISHSGYFGSKSRIKSYPWFPYFQEIHFPENFSYKSKLLRKLNLFMAKNHSTRLIISSKSVLKDLKKINQCAWRKSFLLKHTVMLPEKKDILSKKYLKKKFNIKKDFFYLPNAYWVHKNHIVVLKALREMKKKPLVISTGNFNDHRNIRHAIFIKNKIEKYGLNQCYQYIGIVSERELYSLIFHSVALINPSKSEGWSNTVEQAKIMDKKVILSKNPVHMEQRSKNFFYFEPDNYLLLKKIMNNTLKNKTKTFTISKKTKKNSKLKQMTFIKHFKKLILNN